MRKTWITSALSLALIASLAGQALAASHFQDIKDHPAKDQIEALAARGVINGVTEQSFGPEETLVASQGFALITRGLQLSLGTTTTDSKKASESSPWYTEAFTIARANGLDVPTDIDPLKAMTKEEFVQYTVQAMEKAGKFPMIKLVPAPIADEDQLTPSYQGAVQRALHYKLIALDDSGKLQPKSKLTRAEAAAILFKAIETYEKHKEVKSEATGEQANSDRWMNLPQGVTPADTE